MCGSVSCRIHQFGIVGKSQSAIALRERIAAAATTDTVVLLSGPVGSGRELAARALHDAGTRAGAPFVVVPCAALTQALAESELFGHEKGAFTGATAEHIGSIERASGGSVLFSEVGELPLQIQAKLLRFLEERVVIPLGAAEPRPVNVRVLASTTKDLSELVRTGVFREDLYFRLRVLRVDVAPLAERGDDVLLLAEYFLRQLCEELGKSVPDLADDARAALLSHSWPGNAQELRNCLRGALVFASEREIHARHLDLGTPDHSRVNPALGTLKAAVARAVRETESRIIQETLARCSGNRTRAAKELGLSRRGLQLKMRRYKIT
jgi:two-component system NtrC family response regulator